MDAGIPWKSNYFMDKKQTFLFLAQRSDLRSKFRWFQTSGFLETLKPAERWICPKYSEVTLQLHTAFRIGKHHCLSLNLNFHRINCKCLISLNTHQNQIPIYISKTFFCSLFLFSIDGSMVRPQGRLQLDSRDLFVSWCRQSQSPRQAGEPGNLTTIQLARLHPRTQLHSVLLNLCYSASHA